MPEAASQRRMVWSSEAESSFVPSGEKAQDKTAPWCPPSIARRRFFIMISASVRAGVLRGKRRRAPRPQAR